jgi:tetratricopeptide (TPR) repeat protein
MFGFRARARFEQDAPDEEVIGYAEECRRLAAADDMVSQLQWRAALALVAARAGRIDEAKRWIAEATAILDETETDFLWELGLTAQDRGYVYEQAGEIEEASRAYEQALGYFEQKGDVMDAARARERLAALRDPKRPPASHSNQ